MLFLPYKELVSFKVVRGFGKELIDFLNMLRMTPVPRSLDHQHMDLRTNCFEVRLSGYSPLIRDYDVTPELLIKANFRKSSVAKNVLRPVFSKEVIEREDVLIDRGVVLWLWSREVELRDFWIEVGDCVIRRVDKSAFSDTIGSEYSKNLGLHWQCNVYV